MQLRRKAFLCIAAVIINILMMGLTLVQPARDIQIHPGFHVTPNGSLDGDCSTFDRSCTLAYALSRADAGDEILLHRGYYSPVGAGRNSTFVVNPGVKLSGGWWYFRLNSGPSGYSDFQGINPERTVISADVYHVVTLASGAGTTTLENLKITGGNANGSGKDANGGGLYAETVNIDLSDVNLVGNAASGNGGGLYQEGGDASFHNIYAQNNTASGQGGGMYSAASGTLSFRNAILEANTAGEGSGLYKGTANASFQNIQLKNNTASSRGGGIFSAGGSLSFAGTDEYAYLGVLSISFTGNQAQTGAGLYAQSGAVSITNTIFTNNQASFTGGGLYQQAGSLSITGGWFDDNRAVETGGAVFTGSTASLSVRGTFFKSNTAASGGAIFNSIGALSLTGAVFDRNHASVGSGGAVVSFGNTGMVVNTRFSGNSAQLAGGGFIHGTGSFTLANTIFNGNTANLGGGVYNQYGTDTWANLTFTRNAAGASGGAVYNQGAPALVLSNSILWDNTAPSGAQIANNSTTPQIDHCLIQGAFAGGPWDSALGTNAGSNLDANPLFVDPWGTDQLAGTFDDNLHLQYGSPAADAGSNERLPVDSADLDLDANTTEILPWDLDQNVRVSNSVVDLGAYERHSVYFVKAGANSANLCTSWADACPGLKTALGKAKNGDEIWVAQGTYYPVPTEVNGPFFQLVDGVRMYGGFAGSETRLSERVWNDHETILSGDLDHSGTITGSDSYVVVNGDSLGSDALLNGFTITGGNGDWGGGMVADSSRIRLEHLLFTGNQANRGGGLSMRDSTVTITGVTFWKNSASVAGGGINNVRTNATLREVTFHENSSASSGGGMFIADSPNTTILYSRFLNNTAPNGGGMFMSETAPLLVNTLFSGNAAGSGGAIYCDTNGKPNLINTTLSGNSASVMGGGLYSFGFEFAGQMVSSNAPILRNSIMWGNTAPTGPNLYSHGKPVTTLSNSDVGGLLQGGTWDNTLGLDEGGNLDVDPLFVDPDGFDNVIGTPDDNPRLSPGSPAVDAGANNSLPAPYASMDLDDSPRLANGQVDLGVFEHNRWYVNQESAGIACSSWSDACTDLQTALAHAAGGEEVWVAQGVYRPGAPGSRAAAFQLKDGVQVYGGFAGSEASRDERNWTANPTILSGDLDNTGNRSAQDAYQVVRMSRVDQHTRLDGFTITGGAADGAAPYDRGGGIYVDQSIPRLANLILEGNYGVRGGGILLEGSSPRLEQVILRSNSGQQGGGMFMQDSESFLKAVFFQANSASQEGGGLYIENSCLILANGIFEENTAGTQGGGLYNLAHPNRMTVGLENTVFRANAAAQKGGGVYNDGSADNLLWFYNTTWTANQAVTGGALYSVTPEPSLRNSILWGNTASAGSQVFYENLQSNPAFAYSDIQDLAGGGVVNAAAQVHANGMIAADPLFISASDLRLRPGSPAVDSGSLALLPPDDADLDGDASSGEPLSLDLALRLRVFGGSVDMGAYEWSNAAPVLDASGSPVLASILEDAAANPGTSVASLLASGANGGPISDSDPGALPGIAVTAADGSQGAWSFSLDGQTWAGLGPVLDTQARLLPETALLRFTPAANFNGTASLAFRAWDQTQGTAGTAASVLPGGGITAFSLESESASITVHPVNDAPSFTKGANLAAAHDAGPQTIRGWATALSAGPAGESGQVLSFMVSNDHTELFSVQPALDTAGNLTFTPALNVSGAATVSVVLKDSGGTANGGVDASPAQTFRLAVTTGPVNDLSLSLTAQTPSVLAGGRVAYTLTASSLAANSGSELVFQLTLPAGLSYYAAGSHPACSAAGQVVTCTAAAIPANGAVSVRVLADVSPLLPAGPVTAAAALEAREPDPDPANNQASLTVEVRRPDELLYQLSLPLVGR